MKTLPILAAALLCAAVAESAQAQTSHYTVDPLHTQVHFEVRYFGTSTTRGRFGPVDAHIVLDPAAQRGELSVRIATGGVDSGIGAFDGVLRGGAWLASGDHPYAYFVASRLQFDGERLVRAHGEFTLRGISRPLTLRVLDFGCRSDAASGGEVCSGDFEAEFKRSDYGISFGLPFVADTVRLVIQVEARRDPA